MDPIGMDLLTDLAADLQGQCSRVPQILADSSHPRNDIVAKYVLAQGVDEARDFQMPEPILHPLTNPAILVVGFNPNYGAGEDIPRFGEGLEDYVDFYADRFADHRRDSQGRPAGKTLSSGAIYSIAHYHGIEQMVAEVLGTSKAFGLNTVYCDAYPWKWKQDRKPAIRKIDGECAFQRMEKIVLALKPQVVLTLGGPSALVVGDWTKSEPRPGRTHGNWPTMHVASYHPAAREGKFSTAHKEKVQDALRQALIS